MPKMQVIKSKEINAPIATVYEAISDMNNWVKWSPWLIMDPNVNLDISADGQAYSWEGYRTGAGNMKILSTSENQSVDYDLNFLKPWKSNAKVNFQLQELDGGTKASWRMDSSLPFFLFFMKKSMETFVGMDFERGLNMLKDYAEDGEVHSKLNFLGYSHKDKCKYIGYRRHTSQAKIGPDMQADFQKIEELTDQYNFDMTQAMSIYHKFDVIKDKVEYTAAVAVADVPTDLPTGMISGSMPASKMYTLEHIGPYEHLGNAWSTMHAMIRAKEIKVKKGFHPYETYGNSPQDTDPKDLITHIHFGVKD